MGTRARVKGASKTLSSNTGSLVLHMFVSTSANAEPHERNPLCTEHGGGIGANFHCKGSFPRVILV